MHKRKNQAINYSNIIDVIICLGDVFQSAKGIQNMKSRTEKSVQLYKQNKAKKIIFTGGFKTRKDMSEAEFMSKIAIKMGLPRKDIIFEEQANFTMDNAYYSRQIMDKNKFQSAIIVTSPSHIRRVKYIFNRILKKQKLKYQTCNSDENFIDICLNYIKEIGKLITIQLQYPRFDKYKPINKL
ncbi:YdcF family protein [Patescibacteria group bacterium]